MQENSAVAAAAHRDAIESATIFHGELGKRRTVPSAPRRGLAPR
jgi:hypothetical protein